MRLFNRTLFIIIYMSIVVFSLVLSTKQAYAASSSFFVIVGFMTAKMHTYIYQHHISTSSNLPLARTRIFDEEYNALVMTDDTDNLSGGNDQGTSDKSIGLINPPNPRSSTRRSIFFSNTGLNNSNNLRPSLLSHSRYTEAVKDSPFGMSFGLVTEGETPPSYDEISPLQASPDEQHNKSRGFSLALEEDNNTSAPLRRSETKNSILSQHRKSIVGMGIGQPRIIRASATEKWEKADDMGYFLYRQPQLNRDNWETKPRPNRLSV